MEESYMRGKLFLLSALVATGAITAVVWLTPTQAETAAVPEVTAPVLDTDGANGPACEPIRTESGPELGCGPCSNWCPGASGLCCDCRPGYCMECPQAECVPC